jgi:DNA (cytosine-5)-methyltransferase 1
MNILQIKLSVMNQIKIVDLCAGTGGFSLAFHQVSDHFQTIYANDMVLSSKLTYEKNFPQTQFVCKNLLEVEISSIPSMDILLAGFSCQPFSIAGQKKGFEDDRSDVFWQIIKIMEHHRPRIVVLENVKNLLSHDHGNSFKKIKSAIEGKGYLVKHKVLNTSELTGVPQNRERVFLVCFLLQSDFDGFQFPSNETQPPLINFHSLLDQNVQDSYYYTSKLKIYPQAEQTIKDKNVIYQYRRYYFREYKNGICPTLTANMGSGGHNVPLILDNKGIRKFTPRECFRFQGFPDSYQFPKLSNSELYKLAGNAISVPVVKRIAEKIKNLLIH